VSIESVVAGSPHPTHHPQPNTNAVIYSLEGNLTSRYDVNGKKTNCAMAFMLDIDEY
jgi:hypothetical protein